MRRAVDERCPDLAGLRTEPMYVGMRSKAEFKQIESLVLGDASSLHEADMSGTMHDGKLVVSERDAFQIQRGA